MARGWRGVMEEYRPFLPLTPDSPVVTLFDQESFAAAREVNALFTGDDGARLRAYTLAGAFVRDLIRQHGSSAPAELLARMAAGASFDAAFTQVIGHGVADEEAAFWNRHRFWTRWGPFLTTADALWMMMTLLAIYAIFRRRQQRAAGRGRPCGRSATSCPTWVGSIFLRSSCS